MNAVLAPRTMVHGVEKLPAGHLLLADEDGVRIERYARPRPVPARVASAASHRRSWRASCAPGCATASQRTSTPTSRSAFCSPAAWTPARCWRSPPSDAGAGIAAFTVGFEEREFDELPRAREVARRHGAAHHELVVRASDAGEHLATVARDLDEPRGDATALPYWLLARLAAGHVRRRSAVRAPTSCSRLPDLCRRPAAVRSRG